MSSTLDANVLVYASNQGDPVHPQAIQLVRRLAAGPDLLYLFWPVVLGYLRIVTHLAILGKPLSPREATANAEALLRRPHVRTAGEEDGFWELFRGTSHDRARGNDVPDAHLVALADVDAARARNAAADLEIERWYDSFEAMLERRDIDATLIADSGRISTIL